MLWIKMSFHITSQAKDKIPYVLWKKYAIIPFYWNLAISLSKFAKCEVRSKKSKQIIRKHIFICWIDWAKYMYRTSNLCECAKECLKQWWQNGPSQEMNKIIWKSYSAINSTCAMNNHVWCSRSWRPSRKALCGLLSEFYRSLLLSTASQYHRNPPCTQKHKSHGIELNYLYYNLPKCPKVGPRF